MDWTTLLRSQQTDFINRLKSESASLHYLTNPQLIGYHSELTVVSGEELEQIRQQCWELANKFNYLSTQFLQDEFSDCLTCKLGEVVVKKYLDDLITPSDLEVNQGSNGKVNFRLNYAPDVGIQVKACQGNIDSVKWEISFEDVDKNGVIACVWIQEAVINEEQPEYHLILAGFLPRDAIDLSYNDDPALVGIDELLYGGGLKSYLESLEWKCIHTFTGYSQTVWSVAISLDGQTLASGSKDGIIEIWHLDIGGLVLYTLTGHEGAVFSVAISPDEQTLASGSSDNTIKIWDMGTGELINTLTGHEYRVWTVAISPDGQILASGSDDATIKIWNMGTGELISTLTGHEGSVFSVAISPDGQTLASGSYDNTIKLWHLGTGKLMSILTGHSDCVASVAISPDGQILASGSDDRTIKIWHLGTGELIRTLTGHSHMVSSVAISPDGRILASGGYDNTIKIWDLGTGELRSNLDGDSSELINSIAFSPDGHILVSGSCYDSNSGGSTENSIKIWRRG